MQMLEKRKREKEKKTRNENEKNFGGVKVQETVCKSTPLPCELLAKEIKVTVAFLSFVSDRLTTVRILLVSRRSEFEFECCGGRE